MGQIEQNEEVVAKFHDLTPNQLLVLLHLKVHDRLPYWGIWANDLNLLIDIKLVIYDRTVKKGSNYVITELAENYINNILTLTIES